MEVDTWVAIGAAAAAVISAGVAIWQARSGAASAAEARRANDMAEQRRREDREVELRVTADPLHNLTTLLGHLERVTVVVENVSPTRAVTFNHARLVSMRPSGAAYHNVILTPDEGAPEKPKLLSPDEQCEWTIPGNVVRDMRIDLRELGDDETRFVVYACSTHFVAREERCWRSKSFTINE